MKPESPFIQPYHELPRQLALHKFENALLPGGEVPIELTNPDHFEMFRYAVQSSQLIGLVQPINGTIDGVTYTVGCAGRVRQYRERKDGRINVMLTGVCRFRIIDKTDIDNRFTVAKVDWSEFSNDYESESVEPSLIQYFYRCLHNYFESHGMQVDWKVLQEGPIEKVANNLVLVVNLDIKDKQRLLETPIVSERLELFSALLDENPAMIVTPASGTRIN